MRGVSGIWMFSEVLPLKMITEKLVMFGNLWERLKAGIAGGAAGQNCGPGVAVGPANPNQLD